MSTTPTICPCDSQTTAAVTNLPGLSQIAFRAGDFNDFRRALLTPLLAPALEQALSAWSSGVGIPNGASPAVADFAVMMVEWWAYLADILTFYNERIANEDYLGTAILPESAPGLIRLLGYRPRPAIGATGKLAALVTAGQTATLPAGLQFQSKPGPGQTPQIFELTAATSIAAPDTVPATPATVLVGTPPPNPAGIIHAATSISEASSIDRFIENEGFLFSAIPAVATIKSSAMELAESHVESGLAASISPSHVAVTTTAMTVSYTAVTAGSTAAILLMQGTVNGVTKGASFLLSTRDDTSTPNLIVITSAPQPQNTPTAGKQTLLFFKKTAPATPLSASNARLRRANQTLALWTVNPGGIASTTQVHLASVCRQIRPMDWIVFTSAGTPYLVQVASTTDFLGDASTSGGPSTPGTQAGAINILHTRLDLVQSLPANLSADSTTVLFDWVEFGTLVDQPPTAWDGTTNLEAIQPASFPTRNPAKVLLQDAAGAATFASIQSPSRHSWQNRA
jgi:hypothetical protein